MRPARAFSPALLLPLCWLFLAASRGLVFWRPPPPFVFIEDYTAGNPLERVVFSTLILLAGLTLLKRWEKVQPILRANAALVLLFLFIGLSASWSQFPYVTVKRFVRVSGTLLMALVVLTEQDPARAVRELLLLFFSITLSLSLLYIHAMPRLGIRVDENGYRSWVGLSFTKNNLGQLAHMAALFSLWSLLERRTTRRPWLAAGLLAAALYLLAGSGSMTSVGAFLLGAGLLLLLRGGRAVIQRTTAFLVLLVLLLAAALPLASDLLLRRTLLEAAVAGSGRDLTFSGRTGLWEAVTEYILRRPALGYGYGSFWLGDLGSDLWARFVWHPNQAHNGYLDILVDLGMVGLVLFGLFLLRSFRQAAAGLRTDYAFASLALAALVSICFANLFESTFIRLNHLLWCLFLLFAVDPDRRLYRLPAPRAARRFPGGGLSPPISASREREA